VCYADLAGYHLSDLGRRQAAASGRYLGTIAKGALLITSPLDRAAETAAILAERVNTAPVTDGRLTEWGLAGRWAGVVWEAIPDRFPGELEAYLSHPHDLAFAPESIAAAARRMAAVVADLDRDHAGRTAIIVSHQDPLQALRLQLRERPLSELGDAKPRHGEVITLERQGGRWVERSRWEPVPADSVSD
jgi:probable phosphoglycerate mutase